jgi:hypothetical protein
MLIHSSKNIKGYLANVQSEVIIEEVYKSGKAGL